MERFIVCEFQAFVPVRIGQIAGYAFLDTGATSSKIGQSWTADLTRAGTARLQGALGTTQVERCHLDRVSLLGHDFVDVVAKVLPDEAMGCRVH